MPYAPTEDFSFEKDIAPYAGRYFDKLGSDPSLTANDRMELQGTLLSNVSDIEAQRLKLQNERDKGIGQKLDNARAMSALEEARASRARIEKQDADLAGVQGLVKGIVNSGGTPDEKRQALANAALENAPVLASNQNAKDIFNIGHGAIPPQKEPSITTAQSIQAALSGEDPKELAWAIENNDFSGVAARAQARELHKEAEKEGVRLRHQKDDDAEKAKDQFAAENLKFAKDESNAETPWLEDESTVKATAIVNALAEDPKDIQHYQELMANKSSDRERKTFVENIQLKYRLKKANRLAGAPETLGEKAKSRIGKIGL